MQCYTILIRNLYETLLFVKNTSIKDAGKLQLTYFSSDFGTPTVTL
jgi:hypothetical protein